MSIFSLTLTDFRNITNAHLEFTPHCNIIVGNNASGKTSLLESVYMLSVGRSFRSRLNQRIISHEKPLCRVAAHLHQRDRLAFEKTREGASLIRINGENARSAAMTAELLPVQLMDPNGVELLLDGPSERRKFMDWGVFQHYPDFLATWRDYKRVLQQRNACLRDRLHVQQARYWDPHFIALAEQIDRDRARYLTEFIPVLQSVMAEFLPIKLDIEYQRGWNDSVLLAEALAKNLERDLALGHTRAGPHRADLILTVGGVPCSDVLSRGQLKLVMCAMRIAQGLFLYQLTQRATVFLLDDLASELDSLNLVKMCKYLSQMNAQVIITSLSHDVVAECEYYFPDVKVYSIEQGDIHPGNTESLFVEM